MCADKVDQMFSKVSALVAPLRVTVKEYPEPLTVALEKYPHLDWTAKSKMPSATWLASLRQCIAAAEMGPAHARNIDTVFADVIRGRCSFCIYQPPGSKLFEMWDDEHHQWRRNCDVDEFAEWVRTEHYECFGRLQLDEFDPSVTTWGPPPEPLQQDAFVNSVSKCLTKYMERANTEPLDSAAAVRDKLLFNNGMVYFFDSGTSRLATPTDRLYRRCPMPMPHWDVEESIKADVRDLADTCYEFFKAR